ncbi:MAG: hypothetical protein ACI4RP_07965 [Acutalibacteraceae bacterium]
MTNKEIKRFLSEHRDLGYSPAKFEYSLYLYRDADSDINDLISEIIKPSEEDVKIIEAVNNTTDPQALVNLMRKKVPASSRYQLWAKLIQYEDDVLPLIKRRALTNRQDLFIENTVAFLLRCKTNCCDWIIENYESFLSEYMKSMLCLVLGVRGEKELVPFLINEAKRMERDYPEESFDQGPAIAVEELAVRFYN